jgi:protein SCO1
VLIMRNRRVWTTLLTLCFLAASLGVYVSVAMPAPILQGTRVDNPPDVRDVTLIGPDGRLRSLAEWQGRLVLVFFGYTNCPDVCPLTMAKLAKTYQELGAPDDLQVIMVTVDPEHDTPERVQTYAKSFHPDFIGLTGTPEMIAQASARFFVASIGAEKTPDGTVAHSSHLALIDGQGRMRLVYTEDKVGEVLKSDLQTLLVSERSW